MKLSFKTTTLIAAIGIIVYTLTEIVWCLRHVFALDTLQFMQLREVLGLINIGVLLISMGLACFALCKYRPIKNVSRSFRRLTIVLSVLLALTMLICTSPINLIRINGAWFFYPSFNWRIVLMILGITWLFKLSGQETTEQSPKSFRVAAICGMIVLALPVLLGLISETSYICTDKLLFLRSTCVSTWVRYIVPTILFSWYSVALYRASKKNQKHIE